MPMLDFSGFHSPCKIRGRMSNIPRIDEDEYDAEYDDEGDAFLEGGSLVGAVVFVSKLAQDFVYLRDPQKRPAVFSHHRLTYIWGISCDFGNMALRLWNVLGNFQICYLSTLEVLHLLCFQRLHSTWILAIFRGHFTIDIITFYVVNAW